MSLKTIPLKSFYDSDVDDILNDFYIPAFTVSKNYYRLVGFFSSTAFASAAIGISPFIYNSGKMKLIIGTFIKKEDVDSIEKGITTPEEVLAKIILKEIDEIKDALINEHVKVLAWLVAKDQLEIKIAMIKDAFYRENFIFHQKIGIFEDDEGNIITFSGSLNESFSSWEGNIEEFKVFRSWVDEERKYLQSDISKFNRFWNDKSEKIKVYDIPTAIKRKLIQIAPNYISDIKIKDLTKKPKLRDYQIEAISNWEKNNFKGIFEMATGTGKTFAALGCIDSLIKIENKLFIVISCPYKHLIEQWNSNLRIFQYSGLEIFGEVPNWKTKLANVIFDFNNGFLKYCIIITTPNTLSNIDFIKQISAVKSRCLLIGDEVHGLGATDRKKGLLEKFNYRLGLSATPTRWFDEEGTDFLLSYFGGVVFQYDIDKAIKNGFLCPYEYIPYFATMNSEEMETYYNLTKSLAKSYYSSKNEKERKNIFNFFAIQRQKVIVNSQEKYSCFTSIIDSLNDPDHCLVYCSPEQIDNVQNILIEKEFIQHRFTFEEDIKTRQELLKNFDKGQYKILVAIKCLDEGVDIPSTKIAIILASSTNPREYIQRRGRILRTYPGKEKASIFDVIVLPNVAFLKDSALYELEKNIVRKEIQRYIEFARSSLSPGLAYSKILDILSLYNIRLEEFI